MNNYNGYELDEYAGDYLEEIEGYLVVPVRPIEKPGEMFYGLFKFDIFGKYGFYVERLKQAHFYGFVQGRELIK